MARLVELGVGVALRASGLVPRRPAVSQQQQPSAG
jgi:hypothetical protein